MAFWAFLPTLSTAPIRMDEDISLRNKGHGVLGVRQTSIIDTDLSTLIGRRNSAAGGLEVHGVLECPRMNICRLVLEDGDVQSLPISLYDLGGSFSGGASLASILPRPMNTNTLHRSILRKRFVNFQVLGPAKGPRVVRFAYRAGFRI